MSVTNNAAEIKGEVKRAGQKAAYSPLMETLARVGYGVRGLIYIVMGLLALQVTFGKGGAPTDMKGAIAAIGRQPGGLVILWVVLIGLISYSLWGIVRAVFDPLHKGHDTEGLLARGGFLFSAASYALLIPGTYGIVTGAGRSPGSAGNTSQSMAKIMASPLGHWAIGLIGLAVIAGGIHQIVQGFNNSFDKQFSTYAMSAQEVKIATQLGRFGTATRGLIFALIGGLLCLAAYQSNPNQPVGLDAVLQKILSQPFGIWLLAIVALGLIAFGIYSMLSAAWFRLKR
ncbi:MAG TPA: DUF1206 domain-containing protein [Anaerolineales bacterium]